ncbi:MAG: hypothetical protein LBT79_02145 [Elusimicrobiota bacterium]|jgi:hypothetical protein|nr:hypothetical protein [Elusimicrobiota bacterium]
MQSIEILINELEAAGSSNYLFKSSDFNQIFPNLKVEAIRMLLTRAVQSKILMRFCNGLYFYLKAKYVKGFELYHAAARLREDSFCYLSMESVLSEAGIISQIPLGQITLMTAGRSGIINCGQWGNIEFIHTKRDINTLSASLTYDYRYRLWRADTNLASQDMRFARRLTDL